MIQLILHLLGDYILQSDWMARNKTKESGAAFIHAGLYTLPFLLLTRSIPALAVMFFTHAAIDRWRLARYVIWAKNWMAPERQVCVEKTPCYESSERCHNAPFAVCSATGYTPDVPPWMAVWLMIVADNTLHLAINYISLRWL